MIADVSTSDARDVLSALRAGTVPEKCLSVVAVGVDAKLGHLKEQLEYVAQGKSDFRFVAGSYGAGKTFLCSLLKEAALAKGFAVSSIVVSADAPIGDMAMLYRRVADGLRTPDRLQACALQDVIERWLLSAYERTAQMEGVSPRSRENRERLTDATRIQMEATLADLGDSDAGAARALVAYLRGRVGGDPVLARDAMHWLRGSNRVPVEARRRLGVKGEVTAESALGMLRALTRLVALAKYRGLLIVMDEAETILRLPMSNQRMAAYETLRLLVDACGENQFPGVMLLVTGTEHFLADTQAGVGSYPALVQRLERPVSTDLPEAGRSLVMVLKGLETSRLAEIACTVRRLHEKAYGYEVSARLPDALLVNLARQATTAFGEETPRLPRRFLREVVYLCDLCEEHRDFDPMQYVLGSGTTVDRSVSESQ